MFIFILFIYGLGPTSNISQGLLLTLYLRITPDSAREPHAVVFQPGLSICKASVLPAELSLQLLKILCFIVEPWRVGHNSEVFGSSIQGDL